MLTVLIPTHGRPDLLRRTLESLAECERPEVYRELIVVENGSRDGAEQVVAQLPTELNARYIHFEQGNKSAALNFALESVADDLVLLFDDDVRVQPQILMEYARASAGQTGERFYSGSMGVDYEEPPPDWLVPFLPPSAVGWKWEGGPNLTKAVALGSNWAVYAADVKRLGGFDVRKGPGGTSGGVGQETDMQRRMLEAGILGRYLENAHVWHYVPKSRCSPEWVLQRGFRLGVSGGLQSTNGQATLFGFPRWTWRELVQRRFRAMRSSLTNSREAAFKEQYELQFFRGYRHGCRLASREKAPAPSAPVELTEGSKA